MAGRLAWTVATTIAAVSCSRESTTAMPAAEDTGVTSEQGTSSSGAAGSDTTTTAVGDSTAASTDSGSETTGPPACADTPRVQFVYFVEADVPYGEAEHAAVERMALDFQVYWYEQLGRTFVLADPLVAVVQGEHPAQWYVDTPDGIHDDPRWYRLGNVKTEVYAALGVVDFDPVQRIVNYPGARFDGRVGANFGGAWMDGDDLECIDGGNGGVTFPYDEQGPAHCMGHVAHEFGHVLGLDHTGPETDCMQLGFYDGVGGTGMCDFSPDNVAQILMAPANVGWLDAEPGDRCVP